MRQKSLLIISPDELLIGALQQALRQLPHPGNAAILRQYPTPGQLDGILRQERASNIVIGLSDETLGLLLLEHLRTAWPQLAVAAAHTSLDPGLIVAAHHAGATDFLAPPIDLGTFESLLSAVPKPSSEAPEGRLLCCLSARGGGGASTVALHLAAALAESSGHRVLLIDFDFHTGSIGFRLKLDPKFTLLDALAHPSELEELWEQIVCRWGSLDVLAAPLRAGFSPALLDDVTAVLRSARRRYPWVICDLPVAIYASCLDAMAQAEMVFLVCTPEVPAMQLAIRRIRELAELEVPREMLRLVVNRSGNQTTLQPLELEQLLGIQAVCTLPNDYEEINRATLEGRLISAQSGLGRQFTAFARQLLGTSVAPDPPGAGWRHFLTRLARSVGPKPSSEVADFPEPASKT
jgi:pilus assembly protein CpaE